MEPVPKPVCPDDALAVARDGTTLRRVLLANWYYWLPLLILCIVFVRSHVETSGDRERISAKIKQLQQEIEMNPQDGKPLLELEGIVAGNWSFARTIACVALGKLGGKARHSSRVLLEALDCGDPYVEGEAARALGSVGDDSPDVVMALVGKLSDPASGAAWFAADSLGNLGAAAKIAIPALEKARASDWPPMQYSAEMALGKLRDNASTSEHP